MKPTFIALLALGLNFTAQAELPPFVYDEMKRNAADVVVVQILKAPKADAKLIGKRQQLTYEAKVLRIIRSKSRLRPSATITIQSSYYQFGPGEVGPSNPRRLKKNDVVTAYLTKGKKAGEFQIAAGGHSFEKPAAGADKDKPLPKDFKSLKALAEKGDARAQKPLINLKIEQLTSGTKHHFFGYIGQCRTIPWNAGGRYVLGLEVDRIDRLPTPDEAATVFVIDTHQNNKILRLDKTYAWNPQQGTMFYWHPLKAETQFFFNDRDVKTGKVFVVLYDLEKKKRVHEYKYDDSPIGNGGVAADGSVFLGLNYGRLARLRLVTGYPEALDWSKDDPAPKNDGIFIVDIKTGQRRLLVSYSQLDEALKQRNPKIKHSGLFINHTLLNRKSDRVYFFVRGGWSGKKGDKINIPCSIHTDGSGLTLHDQHIGGHPEWAEGNLLIGRQGGKQIFYDVDKEKVVGQLGTPKMFPKPEGDISLSPSGQWFVNGYKKDGKNYYAVYRRADGAFARSEGIDKGTYSGDIRIDPAPRWNRTNDAILVPGIAKNKTRQMFVIRVITAGDSATSKKK